MIKVNNKIPFKVVTAFTGVDMQRRGIENSNLYDVEVIETCETDSERNHSIEEIISYELKPKE